MVLFRMGQAYGVIKVKTNFFVRKSGLNPIDSTTDALARSPDLAMSPTQPPGGVCHGAGKDLAFICYFRWCCLRYSLPNVQHFLRRLPARWLSDRHGLGSPSITILLAPTAYFAHFRASNGENNVQSCDAWC